MTTVSTPLELVAEDVAALRLETLLMQADAGIARLGLPPHLDGVARRLIRGLSRQEIASEQGIAYQTAKDYTRHIYARTGAHSPIQLLRVALGWPPVATN